MGRSKIIYAGETLIDLTGDSISADKMFVGTTAHGADGEPIAGEFTIDAELSAQDILIQRIKAALQNKIPGGEDPFALVLADASGQEFETADNLLLELNK